MTIWHQSTYEWAISLEKARLIFIKRLASFDISSENADFTNEMHASI